MNTLILLMIICTLGFIILTLWASEGTRKTSQRTKEEIAMIDSILAYVNANKHLYDSLDCNGDIIMDFCADTDVTFRDIARLFDYGWLLESVHPFYPEKTA